MYIKIAFLLVCVIFLISCICINLFKMDSSLTLAKPIALIQKNIQKSDEITKVEFFSQENKIFLKKTNSLNFDVNNVAVNDEYNNLKFSFILDGDYLNSFDEKNYDFKSDIYNNFTVSNNENNLTVLTISENDIFGFKIEEDDNYYCITGAKPNEIYDNIVVIDPGHGGTDPGCESFGYNEKNICLDIALKAEKYINDGGFVKTYLTRKDDSYLDLEQRVKFAEKLGSLLVSVHINFSKDYPNVGGTEVYYYEKENANFIKNELCAEFLCNSISMNFGSRRRENKIEQYWLTKAPNIPSVLCEVGFLSNKNEADRLNSEAGKNSIAKGLSEGINQIFKVIKYNKADS